MKSTMRISHEAIYQWIYEQITKGSDVYKYLVRGAKKRRKRANRRHSRCKIPNRVSIHDRPEEIEQRQTMGHWEGDTVVGKGRSGYIVTLVERKSYYLAASLMENKKPETCNRAILEAFGDIENELIKTITFDNGTEFYQHSILVEALECSTYFADPYSSWQRGRNEHTNGILRRFFPKDCDFSNISQNEVDEAVRKINNRPRKSLDYRTPYEVFLTLPLHFKLEVGLASILTCNSVRKFCGPFFNLAVVYIVSLRYFNQFFYNETCEYPQFRVVHFTRKAFIVEGVYVETQWVETASHLSAVFFCVFPQGYADCERGSWDPREGVSEF